MAGYLPKDYVGVNVRIDQFHEKYPKGSIRTTFKLDGNVAVFTAEVSDGEWKVFNGHSFGQLGREKAFEKLETVAVGRALAFMGFETKAGIASKEEMEVFEENSTKPQGKKTFDWPAYDRLKDAFAAWKIRDAANALELAKMQYVVSADFEEIILKNIK